MLVLIVDTPLNTTRGVNERVKHDGVLVIDLTGEDSFFPGKSQNRVKRAMVNGGTGSNDENNSVPSLRHQREWDDSSDEEDNNMDEEYSEPVVEPTALCRGTRVIRQAKYLDPTHKG